MPGLMSENAPKTPRDSGAGTVDFGYQEVPAAEKALDASAVPSS